MQTPQLYTKWTNCFKSDQFHRVIFHHGRVTPLENGGSPMAVYKVEVSSCQEVWIEVAITPMLM